MSKLRRNKVAIMGDITTYLLLLAYGFFMALPLIYAVLQAFKPYNELFIFPPRFFVKDPTIENAIETLLLNNGYLYTKSEDVYIEREDVFVIYYYNV